MDIKQWYGAAILTVMALGFFTMVADTMGWRRALLGLIAVLAATAAIVLGIALVTGEI